MPKKLEGSCHCGLVEFTLESHTPVPYQLCACSICRKVGGYSGSVNLGGIASTLQIIKGKEHIKKYTPFKNSGKPDEEKYTSERNFCGECSTMLWLWDKTWPELIHPFASAIDTELAVPERMSCALANSKPDWVRWPEGEKDIYDIYGPHSLEEWHKVNGLYVE